MPVDLLSVINKQERKLNFQVADFTLPYNPTLLLGRTDWTYEFEYYKNGKDQLMGVDDTAPYFFRVAGDDQKDAWNLKWHSEDLEEYYSLGPDSTYLYEGYYDCGGFGLKTTIEKIVSNQEISSQPLFLFSGERFHSGDDDYCEDTYTDVGYAAFYFAAPSSQNKQSIYSSDSTAGVNINEENNDYYEGLFNEDLNGDGVIPPFLPDLPSYTPELQENGGKTIVGTKKNDDLEGTKNKNDAIYGKKGNDKLNGLKGDNLLFGGPGQDELIASGGDDFLNGGEGNDLLQGGPGNDIYKLSRGIDTITDKKLGKREKIAVDPDYIEMIEILPTSTGSIVNVSNYGSLIIPKTTASYLESNFEEIFVRYID